MDTNEIIVENIKKLITEMREDETQKRLRKVPFVEGYQGCLNDVERIIKLAESLAGQRKGA